VATKTCRGDIFDHASYPASRRLHPEKSRASGRRRAAGLLGAASR